MAGRTVEDLLREEYFDLLPDARRVLGELEAEVRHGLIPISSRLDRYERLVVTSRIKHCESALEALRGRQEGATFDPDRADRYTLADLNDLSGVRVLAFPRSRWIEADRELRRRFSSWTSDPIPADEGGEESLAFKYHGHLLRKCQIVPMLIGLFWQVEHSATYKPSQGSKVLLHSWMATV